MTALKIEFSPDAALQIRTIATWWDLNRASAPDLFRDELLATLEMLKSLPAAAVSYPRPTIPGLRRVLLQRTRYHVYFTHHEEPPSSSSTPSGTPREDGAHFSSDTGENTTILAAALRDLESMDGLPRNGPLAHMFRPDSPPPTAK